jgi:hypothetical protein
VLLQQGCALPCCKAGINQRVDRCSGGSYVKLAIKLCIVRDRINTIIDFIAAQECGVKDEETEAARDAAGPSRTCRADRSFTPAEPPRVRATV